MIESTLEKYLPRPKCESCGEGVVRPVDVMTNRVVFSCSNRKKPCYFSARAPLPAISKKAIYLDTAIVSRMAKARARGEADSLDFKLYNALKRAAARNLIVCPSSTIVESEAELSTLATTIIDMSRELSDPGLHHELHVREQQLFRALRRWLAGEPPELEKAPAREDAYQSDPNKWHGTFNVIVNARMSSDCVLAARKAKTAGLNEIETIFRAYERDGFSFKQIVEAEEASFPLTVLANGRNVFFLRQAYLEGQIDDVYVWWSTTFEKLLAGVESLTKESQNDAVGKTVEFLLSRHAKATPYSHISGRLQAQLAMLCRGEKARIPDDGDSYDVEHMATFAPYVDVFIADQFFAGIANQKNLRVGDPWGTQIRALPPKDVREFIDWLESLAEGSDVARLSERISESIWSGGFNQDFVKHIRATIPEAFDEGGE